jgi:hypothetical protein
MAAENFWFALALFGIGVAAIVELYMQRGTRGYQDQRYLLGQIQSRKFYSLLVAERLPEIRVESNSRLWSDNGQP